VGVNRRPSRSCRCSGSFPHTRGGEPYAYYFSPWVNWRDPGRPLLLSLRGTTGDIVYRNIPVLTTLTATLSGPAVFVDGSQVLTTTITKADGSYTLHLRPAAGATTGDTFTLEVTLAGSQVERVGAIAWEVYLPFVDEEPPRR